MNKNVLDEMQAQRRNKIGNQSFMILFYLLLIDIALSGLGIEWLSYPTNVFVLMIGTMFSYLIRIIWNGAYLGPKHPKGTMIFKITAALLVSAGIAATAVGKGLFQKGTPSQGDGGAVLLAIFSGVGLIILSVGQWIRKKQNEETKD